MTKFEESELRGRKLLKEFLETRVDKYGFTEDLYARLDAYFRVSNIVVSVEIKLRDKKYEDYSTHLMECEKYDAMISDKNRRGISGSLYACFFGDDTLYLYNTNKIK